MGEQPKALTSTEWDQVILDFGTSLEAQAKWLRLYPSQALLELGLNSVVREKGGDYACRHQLLTYLEEYGVLLIGENDVGAGIGRLVAALRLLLKGLSSDTTATSPPAAYALAAQMLSTTAALLIVTEAIDTEPQQVEALITLLLTCIQCTNHGPDRHVRATACECLRELERARPCLLSGCLGQFFLLSQAEKTHACQAYTLLFLTTLENTARHLVSVKDEREPTSNGVANSGGGTGLLSASEPLLPFQVPRTLTASQPATKLPTQELSSAGLKEFRRAIAFVLESSALMTEWGILELVNALLALVTKLHLPASLFKHHFAPLLSTTSPLLTHAAVLVFALLATADSSADQDRQPLQAGLIHMAMDSSQLPPFSLLVLHWLLALGTPSSPCLYPSTYDPMSVKALKLEALAHCTSKSPVELLTEGVTCVKDFLNLPAGSLESQVFFRTVHRFLTLREPPDELLNQEIDNTLVALAASYPTHMPSLTALIERLLACQVHNHLGVSLLQSLDLSLLPRLSGSLSPYFPMLDQIASCQSLSPSAVLELLRNSVSRTPQTWLRGTQILGVVKTAMLSHQSDSVRERMEQLLETIVTGFSDLDLRDTAQRYLRLLRALPSQKLKAVLAYGVADSATPTSFFRAPSLPQTPEPVSSSRPLQVSDCLHFKRLKEPLLSSSWGLPSSEGKPIDSSPSASSPEHPEILKRYYSALEEADEMTISVPCSLQYVQPSQPLEDGHMPSSYGTALYAVTLHFSTPGSSKPVPAVHVPYLLSQTFDSEPAPDAPELVEVELSLLLPAPTTLDVSVEFTDEKGRSIKGDLKSLIIGIEDLFARPLLDDPKERAELFDVLWKLGEVCSVKLLEVEAKVAVEAIEGCLAPHVVAVEGGPLVPVVREGGVFAECDDFENDRYGVVWKKEGETSAGVSYEGNHEVALSASVLRPETFMQELSTELSKGWIQTTELDSRETGKGPPLSLGWLPDMGGGHEEGVRSGRGVYLGSFHVLIFLPPRYHLLLRVEVSDWSSLVRIRTDYWPCLGYVDEYLEAMLGNK